MKKSFFEICAYILIFFFIITALVNLNFIYKKIKAKDAFSYTSVLEEKQESAVIFFKSCLAQKNNFTKCLEQASAKNGNLEEIYKELGTFLSEKSINSFECHEISHEIGQNIYKRNGNIEKGFEFDAYNIIPDTNCATGYYHGLLIGFSMLNKDPNKFIMEMKNIVVKYEQYVLDDSSAKNDKYKDIIHGIGHAIYIKNYSLADSLNNCKQISENEKVLNLCYSGIFMEKAFQKMEVGLDFDPEECNKQDEEFKYSCFVGIRNSSDFIQNKTELYAKICDSQSLLNFYGCLKTYALEVSGNTLYKFEDISKKFCNSINLNDKRILCYELFTKYYFYQNYTKQENKNMLIENFCLNLPFFDYLRCRKKNDERKAVEFLFMKPDPKYLEDTVLNVSDLKYLFI